MLLTFFDNNDACIAEWSWLVYLILTFKKSSSTHTHRRTVFFARSIIKTLKSLQTLFLAGKVVPPKTSVVGPEWFTRSLDLDLTIKLGQVSIIDKFMCTSYDCNKLFGNFKDFLRKYIWNQRLFGPISRINVHNFYIFICQKGRILSRIWIRTRLDHKIPDPQHYQRLISPG